MQKYHIGVQLASSGLSFYVLGFATGPLICGYSYHTMIDSPLTCCGFAQGVIWLISWHLDSLIDLLIGPLSELYGRRLPYLISWPVLLGIVIIIFLFFHVLM